MEPLSSWVSLGRGQGRRAQVVCTGQEDAWRGDLQAFRPKGGLQPSSLSEQPHRLTLFRWFLSILIFSPRYLKIVVNMVFPVVTYGCESWTVKKAERQRIDAFEL